MSKENSFAKNYISLVKHRLKNNSYKEYELELKSNYFINDKRLTVNQYLEMCQKTEEIVACDEFVFDALNKLVPDINEFKKLDETEKMRYMLQLSKIYKDIKKNIK